MGLYHTLAIPKWVDSRIFFLYFLFERFLALGFVQMGIFSTQPFFFFFNPTLSNCLKRQIQTPREAPQEKGFFSNGTKALYWVLQVKAERERGERGGRI